jgi:hypothetical protein
VPLPGADSVMATPDDGGFPDAGGSCCGGLDVVPDGGGDFGGGDFGGGDLGGGELGGGGGGAVEVQFSRAVEGLLVTLLGELTVT